MKILYVEDKANNIYVLKTDLRALAFPSARTRPRLAASKKKPGPVLRTEVPLATSPMGFRQVGRSGERSFSLWGSDAV